MEKNPNGELPNQKQIEAESQEEKIPYPKSIFFIFSNEFCERFSYYGMRTVLALYLQSYLGYTEDFSTVIYHIFVMLCYFTPLIGGVIADSWLGKYRTILYVSILYAFGNIVLSVGALPQKGIPHEWLSLLGLFLIATGTGGIKPCVSSFGGDQFVVPQQQKQLESFFSIFYFSINAGSVLSCFFTPMLREISCFGEDDCYSLAFGVPAILMILSVVFFVAGKSKYTMKPPDGNNIMLQLTSCVWNAIVNKIKSDKNNKKEHWLDYADNKYSLKQIEDTKLFMKIVYLFTPTIIFWALYEQQGSRWTFQASHMDGRLGSWVIQPDQMQTLNAVLVLLFIPVFDSILYPLFNKLKIIRTSLQKLCWGGFLGALSFVIAGVVQMYMQQCYPVFPSATESQLRIFNNLPYNVSMQETIAGNLQNKSIAPESLWSDLHIPMSSLSMDIKTSLTADPSAGAGLKRLNTNIKVNKGKVSSYMIYQSKDGLELYQMEVNGYKELDKLESGNPKIKFIYNNEEFNGKILMTEVQSKKTIKFNMPSDSYQTEWITSIDTGLYKIHVTSSDGSKREISNNALLEPGGVYVIMLTVDSANQAAQILFTITPPNNINMMWQVPQYIVITCAEILFSITGMEFAFTQSPDSMKSVVSSLWLITDAFGNVIVLVVAGLKIFDNQAYEFFLFAGMMAAVMVIFVIMAMRWKYVNNEESESKSQQRSEDEARVASDVTSSN